MALFICMSQSYRSRVTLCFHVRAHPHLLLHPTPLSTNGSLVQNCPFIRKFDLPCLCCILSGLAILPPVLREQQGAEPWTSLTPLSAALSDRNCSIGPCPLLATACRTSRQQSTECKYPVTANS